MGRKCNVLDCPSDSRRPEDNGVTFHKMPFHPDLRPKWIELCRIPEERQINKVIYVCSRHFRRTDFCNFKGTKYMLKQGALPSVFPWTKAIAKPVQTSKITIPPTENINIENVEIKTEPVSNDEKTSFDNIEEKIKLEPIEENEEEKYKIKKDNHSTSKETVTESNPILKNKPTISINFLPGNRIEANDFNDKWYPATILEVDYDENEVFVEFEKNLNKASEWIPMDSKRLRPPQSSSNVETFLVGEKVMASWIKSNNKFPATIKKVLEDDTYEVLFDDGFTKILKHHKLAKLTGSVTVKGAVQHSSPLFDPVVGSKEERRERKRKLNVAELFGKISNKRHKSDDYIKSEPEDETQSQEDFPATSSSGQCEGEEWTCRWLNGEPIGVESELEGNDGPRRSIIVADHRLPPGWEKHLTQRLHGIHAGKWDAFILNPNGKRFSNRHMVKTWLEDNKLDYNLDRFDFCLHLNRARKLGLYEVTDPEALAAIKPSVSKTSKSSKGTPKSHSNKISTPKSRSTVTLPSTPEVPEPEVEEEEDTSGHLKIIHENDSYKCPIEGCGKNFRKENLAQMHIKHYHPEYTKLLGSTPNVADLAYARTVGEHIDDIVPKARTIGSPLEKEKSVKTETTPKIKSSIKVLTPKVTQKSEDSEGKKLEKPTVPAKSTKDSEIIRLLNSEPKSKTIDSLFDSVKTTDSSDEVTNQTTPSNKYPDIKLKDLLQKSEPIKKDEHRPTGIKTLLPVIRSTDEPKTEPEDSEANNIVPKTIEKLKPGRKRQASENSEAMKRRRQSLKYDTDEMSDFFEGDSQDSLKDKKTLDVPVAVPVKESPEVIIEGGEVIRLVHMRSEEIINCTCGITEEDGLMIQCELCLCWQHAHCNNIQKENEVPEKYVCLICKNPQRMRASKKYMHDQDWLKLGVLATTSYHSKDEKALNNRFEKLRKSHELSGCLIELKEYMHNLKIKLNIAGQKDHPKLYLWNKPWDKPELQETLNLTKTEEKLDIKEENLNSSFSSSDHSYIKSSTFGDIALKSMLEPPIEEIKPQSPGMRIDETAEIKSQSELISILEDNETTTENSIKKEIESADFPKIDLNSMIASNLPEKIEPKEENKENTLSGILSTGSLDLSLSQTDIDLSSLAQLGEVEAADPVAPVHVPQPEAAIDLSDCKMNLLDHVAHFQNLVEERLNCVEAEISELEDQDSNLGLDDNLESDAKTKQTLQMLIRDLDTMRQIAALTN